MDDLLDCVTLAANNANVYVYLPQEKMEDVLIEVERAGEVTDALLLSPQTALRLMALLEDWALGNLPDFYGIERYIYGESDSEVSDDT